MNSYAPWRRIPSRNLFAPKEHIHSKPRSIRLSLFMSTHTFISPFTFRSAQYTFYGDWMPPVKKNKTPCSLCHQVVEELKYHYDICEPCHAHSVVDSYPDDDSDLDDDDLAQEDDGCRSDDELSQDDPVTQDPADFVLGEESEEEPVLDHVPDAAHPSVPVLSPLLSRK